MDFQKRTLNSFSVVRDDMDQFRNSMNDWIMFLNRELKAAKSEVLELKKRVNELETEQRLRF